jgi:hypothetical protein
MLLSEPNHLISGNPKTKTRLVQPGFRDGEIYSMVGAVVDPLVLQPPLPLHVFLPLQPWSLVLQPPWPLQAFLPLQSLVSVWMACDRTPAVEPMVVLAETLVVDAIERVAVPEIRPAKAATASMAVEEPRILVVRFIV